MQCFPPAFTRRLQVCDALTLVLGVLSLFGCGREDIDLGPARTSGGANDPPPKRVPERVPSANSSDASLPRLGTDAAAAAGAPDAAAEDAGQPDDCSAAVPDGLVAARPPMGWNGYNAFGEDPALDEDMVRATVDVLVDSGMQSAGYRYVNLDTGWQLDRSAEGERIFDAARLPSGIEALVEYVHGRGFSFGFYSHVQTCQQMAGGEGHEAADVESYVRWGVDYLKYVNCAGGAQRAGPFSDLAAALRLADSGIVLSIAAPPFQEWMRAEGQLWRISGDAEPTWSSIVNSIDAAVPLAAYARPGAFNDPDMLEIGNGSLTEGEQRVEFSVWSILAAPLIAGNDLTTMSEDTRAILTNVDVIAFDQDPLGLQGAHIRTNGNIEILAKPLAACGARAVVLWNRSTTSAEAALTWDDIGLEPVKATARELWSGSVLDTSDEGVSVVVPGHDALALWIDGIEPPLPRGTVYLSDLHWTYATSGYGPVEVDSTNGEAEPLDGSPIRLRGAAHEKGLGVHSPSLLRYRLGQACSRFLADLGIDDDQDGAGSVEFEVWADGERLYRSGVVTGVSPTISLDLDVRERRELRLFVGQGGDTYARDHAVWAGATLQCDP